METISRSTELLTIAEVAEWLRLSPAGIRALIKRGKLRLGIHYVRPPGLSTRFKKSAIENWLDGKDEIDKESDTIKMVKGYRMK